MNNAIRWDTTNKDLTHGECMSSPQFRILRSQEWDLKYRWDSLRNEEFSRNKAARFFSSAALAIALADHLSLQPLSEHLPLLISAVGVTTEPTIKFIAECSRFYTRRSVRKELSKASEKLDVLYESMKCCKQQFVRASRVNKSICRNHRWKTARTAASSYEI